MLALAFTESSLDYNAKHKLKTVKGICGIDTTYWKEDLSQNGIRINSLNACLYVYDFYLEKTKDKKEAIRKYKGIKEKRNNHLVNEVIKIEQIIKEK